jgi:glutamine cyclotransferase
MQRGVRRIAPLERQSVKLFLKAALLTALVVCGCVCMFSCPGGSPDSVTAYTYRVVNTYPHDVAAFTQGLDWDEGALYEGTGLTGKSSLRRVALDTGEVVQRHDLAETYFGEGIAVFGGRIVQLTWQSGVGFVYDKTSFEETGQFRYPGEGWGLTYDGNRLIMSDGTATLRFLDPDTFAQTGQIQVRDTAGPVVYLNELEWVEGKILANVWRMDRIARIDPDTGRVTGWIDLTGLLPAADRTSRTDVLNGIAYDEETKRLFVTGKRWPKLFEIELIQKQ